MQEKSFIGLAWRGPWTAWWERRFVLLRVNREVMMDRVEVVIARSGHGLGS